MKSKPEKKFYRILMEQACANGDLSTVKALMESNILAGLSKADLYGLIETAASNGQLDVFRYLADNRSLNLRVGSAARCSKGFFSRARSAFRLGLLPNEVREVMHGRRIQSAVSF